MRQTTPMPAETFKQSTHQINPGTVARFQALSRFYQLCSEIIDFVGGVQPSGCQPTGVTR